MLYLPPAPAKACTAGACGSLEVTSKMVEAAGVRCATYAFPNSQPWETVVV